MSREELKYSELTELIISAAMKVHRSLGPGFPEIIYQRAVEVELKEQSYSILKQSRNYLFSMKEF